MYNICNNNICNHNTNDNNAIGKPDLQSAFDQELISQNKKIKLNQNESQKDENYFRNALLAEGETPLQ